MISNPASRSPLPFSLFVTPLSENEMEEDTPIPIQVAGHGNMVFSPIRGRSYLRKPTNSNEVEMYRSFQKDPNLASLLSWIPRCVEADTREGASVSLTDEGASEVASPSSAISLGSPNQEEKWESPPATAGNALLEDADHSFVELENLLLDFRFPCVLDIKLGAVRWTPATCPKKVKKIQEKEGPTSSPQLNAFRLCGVHRFGFDTATGKEDSTRQGEAEGAQRMSNQPPSGDSSSATLRRWVAGKDYGRNMDRQGALLALKAFFSPILTPSPSEGSHAAMPTMKLQERWELFSQQLKTVALDQMRALASSIDDSRILQIYSLTSVSLHIAYDAELFLSHATGTVPRPILVKVHLIDFARCGPLQSGLYFDDSVVRFREGLGNLIALMEAMVFI